MSTPTTKTTTAVVHVLALPFPAQGHVLPFLETMQWLGPHGVKVTFVNTDANHDKVLSGKHNIGDHIELVSIPDGMEPWEDRTDFVKWTTSINEVMPRKVEELILNINRSEEHKITCLIGDYTFTGWTMRLAKKLGLKAVTMWPLSATQLVLTLSIPKLMQDGIIDQNGTPKKMEVFQLTPKIPPINPLLLPWASFLDPLTNQTTFNIMTHCRKDIESADRVICNSTYELEPGTFDLYPNIKPIGPLLAKNRNGDSTGYFWKEDLTCMEWLDQQPPNSVIYIAFGSFTVFDKTQFQELALGLEMSKKPFLWVLRPDMMDKLDDAFTKGFRDRVGDRGRIIGWAPQQRVLGHPSLACFLSHCGWNSTMEGLSNGLPFLCWPYFGDQPLNQSYICEVWKVGLGFNRDASGIIRKHEILEKVEKLLGDKTYKERAMKLKDVTAKSVSNGGLSNKNFNNLIDWLINKA